MLLRLRIGSIHLSTSSGESFHTVGIRLQGGVDCAAATVRMGGRREMRCSGRQLSPFVVLCVGWSAGSRQLVVEERKIGFETADEEDEPRTALKDESQE